MRRAGALAAVLTALAVASVVAGCGAGAGKTPSQVKLTVTDAFGARTVLDKPGPQIRGSDTVMRLLQRNADVSTRYGGGFVQSINGLAGGRKNGRSLDWFYFVNGVLAEEGAASTKVRPGDRIWWDRHDWGVTNRVPAVVGSFPEPFVHGIDGERLATRIECIEAVDDACDTVQKKLTDLGLAVGRSTPGTGGGTESLRLVVGPWKDIRRTGALFQIERGPRSSGVYGRFDASGSRLTALDATGKPVRTLGAKTGLVAATQYGTDAPVWMVTGTDADGVRAAANAFDESVLNEKFALAIGADGLPVALPAPAEGAR